MSIFSLFQRSVPKTGGTNLSGGNFTFFPSKLQEVTKEDSLKVSVVVAALRAISESISMMPLHLYYDDGKTKIKAVDSPLYALMKSSPNEEITSQELIEWLINSILIYGNGYAFVDRDLRGNVIGIFPLQARKVQVLRAKDGDKALYYKITTDSGSVDVSKEDMLHIPNFVYDGIIGKSIIDIAANTIALSVTADQYASQVFASGGTKKMAVNIPPGLSTQAIDNIRASFKSLYGGSASNHTVAFLQDDMKVQVIGVDPNEAQLLGSREFNITEICRFFRIPPHVIQDLSRSTNNNIESQSIEFVKYCLLPYVTRIESRLNKTLISEKDRGRFFFKFGLDGLLRADSAARSSYYREMLTFGALSINEIREMEDMNPIENGDIHLVPLNMTPLSVMATYNPNEGVSEERSSEQKMRATPKKRRGEERRRLRNNYVPLIKSTYERIVKAEIREIKKNINKRAEVDIYDEKFREFILNQLKPAMDTLARSISEIATSEAGIEQFEQLQEWIDGYVERSVNEHIQVSQALLDEMPPEEIEVEVEKWIETRPEKVANHETRNLAEVIATAIFKSAGVAYVWRATGDSCNICNSLNGRVVGSDGTFEKEGNSLGSGESVMKLKKSVKHAPLHSGCDCFVEAD